jgi:hypothetical protein
VINTTAVKSTTLISMNTVVTTGFVSPPSVAAANASHNASARQKAGNSTVATATHASVTKAGNSTVATATHAAVTKALNATVVSAGKTVNASIQKKTDSHIPPPKASKFPPIVRKEMSVAPLKWNFTPMAAVRLNHRINSSNASRHIQANSSTVNRIGANAKALKSPTGNRTNMGLLVKDKRMEKVATKEEKDHYDGFLSKFVG